MISFRCQPLGKYTFTILQYWIIVWYSVTVEMCSVTRGWGEADKEMRKDETVNIRSHLLVQYIYLAAAVI